MKWMRGEKAGWSRREFVVAGAAGLFVGYRVFGQPQPGAAPVVRFGMVTDLHYADIDPDPAPVLNACFDSTMKPYSRSNPWDNANVPPEELDWFARELAAANVG